METVFPQNFHTKKLGETTVFYSIKFMIGIWNKKSKNNQNAFMRNILQSEGHDS